MKDRERVILCLFIKKFRTCSIRKKVLMSLLNGPDLNMKKCILPLVTVLKEFKPYLAKYCTLIDYF